METTVDRECVSGKVHRFVVNPYNEKVSLLGEAYVPTAEEYEYGRLARLHAKSHAGLASAHRPVINVYHDGYVREVYTDTWTLVPARAPLQRAVAKAHLNGTPVQKRKRYGVCERCAQETLLTRHHVVHKSKGGGEGANIQKLCRGCHEYVHNVLRLPSGVRVAPLHEAQQPTEIAPTEPAHAPRSWWVYEGRQEADRAYEIWLRDAYPLDPEEVQKVPDVVLLQRRGPYAQAPQVP